MSSWSERSELRGCGGGREIAPFERVNPELGGGERSKARVRKAVKMWSGDASDAMDAEWCIISITKGCEAIWTMGIEHWSGNMHPCTEQPS